MDSFRWSVTAVLALSPLGCSDPVPPAAQASLTLELTSGVAGKTCAVTAVTKSVPDTGGPTATNAAVRVIDGEPNTKVSCAVKPSSGGFSVSADISYKGVGMSLQGGTIVPGGTGTATMQVSSALELSLGGLASAPGGCTLSVVGGNLQVQKGSMWGTFNCPSVEHAPSDGCRASGVFVLENCEE